jgi:dTDP-glucose pyrophosphorylase
MPKPSRAKVDSDFILTACDSLLSVTDYFRLLSTWNEGKKPASLLTLQQVKPEQVSQTAIVQIEKGLITQIVEKPAPHQVTSNFASLPIYLFDRCIFSSASLKPPERRVELQDAIQAHIDDHNLVRGEFVSGRMNLTLLKIC